MSVEVHLSALVRDVPYVLARITGLFSHRTHSIRSLTFAGSDQSAARWVTLTVSGEADAVNRAVRHLEQLHDVLTVTRHPQGETAPRPAVR